MAELRPAGRDIPDELLAHISPAHSENINFFGTITIDIEAELSISEVVCTDVRAPLHRAD